MRGAPPVSLTGERDPVWWIFCCAVSLAAVLTTLAWTALFWPHDTPWQRLWRSAVPIATAVGAAVVVRTANRPRRWALRWDGQHWWLAVEPGATAPGCGDLAPMIDVGPWLLLRFRQMPSERRWRAARTRWLSLHRTTHAGHWHALRCAVYSPRPAHLGHAAPASGAPVSPS